MNWHKIFPKIYIKISPKKLHARLLGTALSVEIEPKVAIDTRTGKSVAVAEEVQRVLATNPGHLKVVNGFNHPRIVIGDFDAAGEALKYMIDKLFDRKVIIAPIVVIQPPLNLEGGLTQVERRALSDLCFNVGAREVIVAEHDLSERELSDLKALKKKLKDK